MDGVGRGCRGGDVERGVRAGGARSLAGGADDDATTTTTTTSSSSGGQASVSVLAMLVKDVPAGPGQGPGGSLSDIAQMQVPPDPDALVLLFSNQPQVCADPAIGSVCSIAEVWQCALVVPPDLVRVGPVDLANPRISVYSWAYFGGGGEGVLCGGGGGGGGGGPAPGGTLEIVSSDAGSVSVRVSGGVVGAEGFIMNGMMTPTVIIDGAYTFPRCEAAPPTPAPGAAVAIRGADLPAGLPSNPTIGATPDATALYVFLGSGAQTCADPLGSLGCMGDARVVLRIPASIQQPGVIDLADPRLAVSLEVAPEDGTGTCAASVGVPSFTRGTLTVTSVDAGAISFVLYESLAMIASGGSFDADGAYEATVCP